MRADVSAPAPIDWRPLGQFFVDAGLISPDELEEALGEQGETSRRLGEILVSRGLVSTPDLTRALLDQLGRELERERPNGIALRARATNPPAAPAVETPQADPATPGSQEASAPDVEGRGLPPEPDLAAPAPPLATPSSATVADAAEVAATADPHLLLRQIDELRNRLTSEFAARESMLLRKLQDVERHLEALEEALTQERSEHRRTLDDLEQEKTAHRRSLAELDRGRAEAGEQAAEIRSCLGRIRAELGTVDAGMAWFDYWAHGAAPAAPATAPDDLAR